MKTKTITQSIFVTTVFILFGMQTVYSQKVSFAVRASYESFTLSYDRNYFDARDYYNGFGVGAFVTLDDERTILNYYTGIDFSRLHTEHYKMNFVGLPLGIDLEVGKQFGFFLGGCLKLRYQVNQLTRGYNEEFNDVTLSWMIRSGFFASYKNTLIRLYPKLESAQDPVIEHVPFSQTSFASLYLTTFSLNLEVQF